MFFSSTFFGTSDVQLCTEMAIKLHTVQPSETNIKHYSCVSGQNHFKISTPGIKRYDMYAEDMVEVTEIANVEFPTLRYVTLRYAWTIMVIFM
jgi:hypothetical protein